MSRIAGVLGGRAGLDRLLGLCATGVRVDLGARAHSAPVDRGALGWWGAGDAQLHAGDSEVVALDGAVYNRAELGGADGDAALIARLAERLGFRGAREQLSGDFAVALLDRRTGELWLARDRMGV